MKEVHYSQCAVVGRHAIMDDAIYFDWAGVEICIQFSESSQVKVRMDGGGNDFLVILDDVVISSRLHAKKGVFSEYEIASDLSSEQHQLRIIKRTEPQLKTILSSACPTRFSCFLLDDNAQIEEFQEKRDRTIEFVGDSNTVAFGVEGPETICPNVASGITHENIYSSYATHVAKAFNAKSHIIAWTGKGVATQNFFFGKDTMVDLYTRKIASNKKLLHKPDKSVHVSIVNLGSNDFLSALIRPSHDQFKTAYEKLLKQIRLDQPDAIIFAVTLGEETFYSYHGNAPEKIRLGAKAAVEALHEENYENIHHIHITTEPLTKGSDETDYGVMMHWNASGHKKIAKALIEEISGILNWPVDTSVEV